MNESSFNNMFDDNEISDNEEYEDYEDYEDYDYYDFEDLENMSIDELKLILINQNNYDIRNIIFISSRKGYIDLIPIIFNKIKNYSDEEYKNLLDYLFDILEDPIYESRFRDSYYDDFNINYPEIVIKMILKYKGLDYLFTYYNYDEIKNYIDDILINIHNELISYYPSEEINRYKNYDNLIIVDKIKILIKQIIRKYGIKKLREINKEFKLYIDYDINEEYKKILNLLIILNKNIPNDNTNEILFNYLFGSKKIKSYKIRSNKMSNYKKSYNKIRSIKRSNNN